MQYYPHHIGDFDKATRHLTRIERSVYRDLIDLYYDTEFRLPLDEKWICRKIIARSNDEATAVEQTLNEFFVKTETGWYHSRCEAEIEHYRKNNGQKAKAGKASAASKAIKRQQAINGCSTAVDQTNNGAPTNQEPGTNNQEPITSIENTVADGSDDFDRDDVIMPTTDAERELRMHAVLVKPKPAKATPKPAELFELPDWINRTHWDAWHSCVKRKKATPEQKQLSIDKLSLWREAKADYAGALENAAVGGYQGLFLPNHAGSPMPRQNKQEALEARNRQVADEWVHEMQQRSAG